MIRSFRPSPFKYQSRLDSWQLRLLQPVGISQERLSFRVIEVPRTAAPGYSAVSYTWGDQPPSEVIYLNDQEFHIRPNLWSCLYYLSRIQQTSTVGYLWADAICINQDDDAEKAAQVRRMDQTYRDAAFVSVWLGLISLPDHITVISNNAPIKTLDTDSFDWQDTNTIADLSNRPYWSRFWVIQEFLLARHVRLHCSNSAIDWEGFRDILSHEAGIDPLSDDPLANLSRRQRSSADSHPALPLILGRHIDKHPKFLQPLYHLLIEYRKSRCKDPRDRVFALLGLVTKEERGYLELCFPNYELSEEHVLIITLAHLTQLGPLVTSLRDQETITLRSDDLFEGLGVESLAKRERLLRRASDIDYLERLSSVEMSRILELHDEMERYDESVELNQGDSVGAPWSMTEGEAPYRAMEAWSKIFRGTVIFVLLGMCFGILNYIISDGIDIPGSTL